MDSNWIKTILLLTIGSFVGINYAQITDSCWEKSFETFGTEDSQYKDLYNDILETALELNYIKDVYKIKKIAFLIDSAVGFETNSSDNLLTGELRNDAHNLKFEIGLIGILNMILNVSSVFYIQYDEENAWTCEEFGCLQFCPAILGLTKQSPMETGPTSHCPGNIEAACSLAHRQMNELDCSPDSKGALMIVAITNGNFVLRDGLDEHQRGCPLLWFGHNSDKSFSPCLNYFSTRYIIGTSGTFQKSMKRFPSYHGNYRHINAEMFSYEGMRRLFNSIIPRCCTFTTTVVPTICKKSQGPLGDSVINFPTHAGLSPNYNAFG